MERGVITGERTEAGQLRQSAGSPDHALTARILEIADGAGYRAALIDGTDGSVTGWPLFASTVRDFQDARGQGTVRRARALAEQVCLRAFPDTDAAFHQNLPARLSPAGGPWRGTGARPAAALGLPVPTPPWEPGRRRVSGPGATV